MRGHSGRWSGPLPGDPGSPVRTLALALIKGDENETRRRRQTERAVTIHSDESNNTCVVAQSVGRPRLPHSATAGSPVTTTPSWSGPRAGLRVETSSTKNDPTRPRETMRRLQVSDRSSNAVVHAPDLRPAAHYRICVRLIAGEVTLEEVTESDVEEAISWSLDPVAQGPFKQVPRSSREALRAQILADDSRRYFYITWNGRRVGRFYFRRWSFLGDGVDWELNTLVAAPDLRGRGIGTDAKRAAIGYLKTLPESNAVFAYTHKDNVGAQKSLERAGLIYSGPAPTKRFPVPVDPNTFVMYSQEISGH